MARPGVKRLAEHVANQIAAGEVVARPSSVVKELVENALDAESRSITIAIEGGGVELVRVVDDGVGMAREDALLALERHATSKLTTVEDLRTLRTLGFRGEALPSIASVSRFTLRTRTAGEDEGTELVVEGNSQPRQRPCGSAIGTTIEVRELFFNVPARRKFLRALTTESAHVGDAVRETAFAHPGVQFELWRDGRLHKRWLRAKDCEERARDILGATLTLRIAESRGPLGLEAYLSPPERVRSGATGLTILVNHRPVQDRAIARAVAAAYGDRIERGKYPLGVILLELPTEDCDVNVHPQKAEVRFSEPRAVCDAIYAMVQRAISTSTLGQEQGPITRLPESVHAKGFEGSRPSALWSRHAEGHPIRESKDPWTWTRSLEGTPSEVNTRNSTAATKLREPTGSWGSAAEASTAEETRVVRTRADAVVTYLCEVADCLVARDLLRLLFVDRWAAELRVTARRAAAELELGKLTSQPLLFPQRIEVAQSVVNSLDARQASFERLGFELRAVGPRTLAAHAVPKVWSRASAEALIRLVTDPAKDLVTDSDFAEFLARASGLTDRTLTTRLDPQSLLDAWYESLGGADPRDAAETRHHLALSELAPRAGRV